MGQHFSVTFQIIFLLSILAQVQICSSRQTVQLSAMICYRLTGAALRGTPRPGRGKLRRSEYWYHFFIHSIYPQLLLSCLPACFLEYLFICLQAYIIAWFGIRLFRSRLSVGLVWWIVCLLNLPTNSLNLYVLALTCVPHGLNDFTFSSRLPKDILNKYIVNHSFSHCYRYQ